MSPADHRVADHRRILIVDDEPQITRVLRTSLDAHGYDLRVANDGDTALQIARDWTPDLMITDLSMPVMDGLELCRRFRRNSNAPIIVLSVKGEERTKVQALDAGADDYVTKPFGINELLARLIKRCDELDLHIKVDGAQQDLQVSAYITTLVMNYLFTGKFKRTK